MEANQGEEGVVSAVGADKEAPKKVQIAGVPEHISDNQLLADAISILPAHYNFEIYKTLHRIEVLAEEIHKDALKVSLQFPEGLMLFACIISDILREFSPVRVETVIMGDVTYGACCVDDLASEQMDCDLLVHYGHSCLVPVTDTRRKVLYVFVEIQIDIQHFIDSVVFNFQDLRGLPLYVLGTIQFNNSLFLAKTALADRGFTQVVIPQEKPRSAGEVLGCTSPKFDVKKD
jgi:2-(3-amino-3-carboxypropyl)histidine synthase